MFEVISGTYEEFEGELTPNCKFTNGFDTFEEAYRVYKRQTKASWAALYMGVELVLGYDPL